MLHATVEAQAGDAGVYATAERPGSVAVGARVPAVLERYPAHAEQEERWEAFIIRIGEHLGAAAREARAARP